MIRWRESWRKRRDVNKEVWDRWGKTFCGRLGITNSAMESEAFVNERDRKISARGNRGDVIQGLEGEKARKSGGAASKGKTGE
jgi:hypothetical protein